MKWYSVVPGAPRPRAGLTLLAAGLLTLASCATAASPPVSDSVEAPERASPASSPVTRDLALATFDSAWSRVHNSYYDSTFRGLDWRAVHAELRPRAAAAATTGELRNVLNEMLSRLGESHFGIIPRESVDEIGQQPGTTERADGDAGLALRWVDGELMVTHVQPEGGAAAAGVRGGWIVEAIGEQETAGWKAALARAQSDAERRALLTGTISAARSRLTGPEGSIVAVRFRDGRNDAVTLELKREPVRGEPVQFGNLPTFFSYLEHHRAALDDGGCAGVIHFNVWMPNIVREYDRAVDAYSECHGIVIDLRGNPGGVGGLVMGTSGSFFDSNVPLGVMRTRSGEVRFVAMPRRITHDGQPRGTFTGPVAVLVDEQSMSTSEIFAAGMQAAERARIFGTATPGYALPALMLRLPNQDVLYHAIANLTDPNGRRIEGAGVIPDQTLPLTRADLLAGRDRALEAALEWIDAQPRATTSGQ